MKELTIREFTNKLDQSIDSFEEHWENAQAEKGKDMYPEELRLDEWLEQFMIWLTL